MKLLSAAAGQRTGTGRRTAGIGSRIPLRLKLVAAILVLGAVAMALFGSVGTARLRSTLEGTLDNRLTGVTAGLLRNSGPRSFGGGDGGQGGLAGNATWVAYADDSGRFLDPSSGATTTAASPGFLDSGAAGQHRPALPTVTAAFAAAHPGPFTVTATGSGARWRVLVVPASLNGTGITGTLIIALTQESVDGPVNALARIDLILGAGLLLLLGVAAWLVVRSSLKPLVDVEHTAEAIAAGDLSRRVPVASDRTEVGRLGVALNTMLGRIESAFSAQATSEAAALATADQMRRFAADASHELRTPLTSIRGFAELHRAGVIPPGPDTDRAMERIENESIRMTGLVEDLLLLARLDQQRPLERRPVDLLAIAADAVHDAAAIAGDHPTSLEVPDAGGDAPPAVVVGDEARLRQVASNLVANALHHTPPGTSVVVRVTTAASTACLEVADDGPGLDAEQAQRIFERFYRADSSRTRASGGSGLGLSIVAALVRAHHGTVEVRTAPGHGATFRVLLPLATPAGPDAGGAAHTDKGLTGAGPAGKAPAGKASAGESPAGPVRLTDLAPAVLAPADLAPAELAPAATAAVVPGDGVNRVDRGAARLLTEMRE